MRWLALVMVLLPGSALALDNTDVAAGGGGAAVLAGAAAASAQALKRRRRAKAERIVAAQAARFRWGPARQRSEIAKLIRRMP